MMRDFRLKSPVRGVHGIPDKGMDDGNGSKKTGNGAV
jgi:hypothetical protein